MTLTDQVHIYMQIPAKPSAFEVFVNVSVNEKSQKGEYFAYGYLDETMGQGAVVHVYGTIYTRLSEASLRRVGNFQNVTTEFFFDLIQTI